MELPVCEDVLLSMTDDSKYHCVEYPIIVSDNAIISGLCNPCFTRINVVNVTVRRYDSTSSVSASPSYADYHTILLVDLYERKCLLRYIEQLSSDSIALLSIHMSTFGIVNFTVDDSPSVIPEVYLFNLMRSTSGRLDVLSHIQSHSKTEYAACTSLLCHQSTTRG